MSDFCFPRITSNHLLCHYASANGDIHPNVLHFPVTEGFESLSSTDAKRGWLTCKCSFNVVNAALSIVHTVHFTADIEKDDCHKRISVTEVINLLANGLCWFSVDFFKILKQI